MGVLLGRLGYFPGRRLSTIVYFIANPNLHLYLDTDCQGLKKEVVMSNYVSLGYQQITSLTTAQSLTVPAGTTLVCVRPETQNVRWRDDGTDPTATVGYPLQVGEELQYDGQFARIKFIEQTSAASLNILYLKQVS